MPEFLLLYCLVLSFIPRLYFHRKLMVAGHEQSMLIKIGQGWFKATLFTSVVVLGLYYRGVGPCYSKWYEDFSTKHSIGLWVIVNVIVLVALWTVKEATYWVQVEPARYEPKPEMGPQMYRPNMNATLLWNTLFYSFLALTPTLPFRLCLFGW